MKIMVFDVAASTGGALTILKQYYEDALIDLENEWIFVISTPNLENSENVKILKYPYVKKSWFHRLYFDKLIARKIVDEYKVDEVLSLQNVLIKNVNVKQTLYLHQPLPFVEKRYRLTENLKFWIYQNVIIRMIYQSVMKADRIIVQTKWIKEACLSRVKTDPNKFEIDEPRIKVTVSNYYKKDEDNFKLFFYPSSAMEYKNHSIIVEATQTLVKANINNFKILFTLNGSENKRIKNIYKVIKNERLPIEFIGYIDLDKVYDYYSKSILIFPSYIETFGLPLLEAKLHNSPILASNCAFSHEILDDYNKVEFFDPHDSLFLSTLIIKTINNEIF